MAKLPIGTKVFIIETGEIGFVIDYYPDFTVAVDVEGEFKKLHQTGIIAAREFGLSENKTEEGSKKDENNLYATIEGIILLFKAIKNLSGEITRFDVFLVNHSGNDLLFLYEYFCNNTLQHKVRKEIKTKTHLLLHEFKTDHLNDNPACHFDFWVKTSDQTSENPFSKEVKLKAKQFFSKLESDEFLKNGYLFFELQKNIPARKENKQQPDFDWEEFENTTHKKKIVEEEKTKNHDVIQKANMPDHIDLHIEKLEKNFRQLSNADMLQIQLRHCRIFLEKAIRYKLDKIYVIHGLGKGVLKNEIEKLLKQYPEIESYNNNYHPRFGFGATEIIL
ncbi:MAG: DUF2027 domain-containing protein [Fimbriimonadaceae bacterium]|nr:DUF2027 domain-containing protein [Chitinophagales bacterium]